mmetsp:Transcript_103340/g.163276  ORF Transcript_103340/g.163276 Transcript_103340/m.163276 type:complete len:86 (+) Transcript_103340:382-639(+)
MISDGFAVVRTCNWSTGFGVGFGLGGGVGGVSLAHAVLDRCIIGAYKKPRVLIAPEALQPASCKGVSLDITPAVMTRLNPLPYTP